MPPAGIPVEPLLGSTVPILLVAAGGFLVLLALMATAFVRIATVLAILRLALGLPAVPPAAVVSGLALVLTLAVMAPVAERTASALKPVLASAEAAKGPSDLGPLWDQTLQAASPLKSFLKRIADPKEVTFFRQTATDLSRSWGGGEVAGDSFRVLLPAFMVGELKEAFRIGFLLFIPFVVIDLIVVNLLMAIGLGALQPIAIALPLKLLLFVLADGWHLVAGGLVKGFVPH